MRKFTKEEIKRMNKALEILENKLSNRDFMLCGILDKHVKDGDVGNIQGFKAFLKEVEDKNIIFIQQVLTCVYEYCLGEKRFMLPMWVQARLGDLSVEEYPPELKD